MGGGGNGPAGGGTSSAAVPVAAAAAAAAAAAPVNAVACRKFLFSSSFLPSPGIWGSSSDLGTFSLLLSVFFMLVKSSVFYSFDFVFFFLASERAQPLSGLVPFLLRGGQASCISLSRFWFIVLFCLGFFVLLVEIIFF